MKMRLFIKKYTTIQLYYCKIIAYFFYEYIFLCNILQLNYFKSIVFKDIFNTITLIHKL